MKKWMLTFSCFFILFSCTNGDSSGCGCGIPSVYDVSLDVTVVDCYGNSFKVTEVRLEDEILCFQGEYVFQNLDSNAFFLSGDGLYDIGTNPHDFRYTFSLEETNLKNNSTLTGPELTLSGEWTLCFQVDAFFLSEMENIYYEDVEIEKELYAYFKINDERAYTLFYVRFSQIVVV